MFTAFHGVKRRGHDWRSQLGVRLLQKEKVIVMFDYFDALDVVHRHVFEQGFVSGSVWS